MKKVVHLTSVHTPLDPRIFHKECRTLADAGYEVVLVAPAERDEQVAGVRIRAVARPGSRPERMTRTVLSVLGAALAERAALYHFHDPELIPAGLALKATGARVVYDVHEHVPLQVRSKPWLAPALRNGMATAAELTERLAGAVLDAIVTVTPTLAARFPADRTVLVANYPMLHEFAAGEGLPYRERPPEVLYLGIITGIRGVREMVEAIGRLPGSLGATLQLAGKFVDEPETEAAVRALPGWARTRFLGWQARPQVAALLGRARVGLLLLHPTVYYLDAYPTKLYEYMAAGVPVVGSDIPLVRQVIDETGCGLAVDPLDPDAVAAAVRRLLEDPAEAEAMGRRGQAAVRERYNWAPEGARLVGLYDRLLPGGR